MINFLLTSIVLFIQVSLGFVLMAVSIRVVLGMVGWIVKKIWGNRLNIRDE